MACKPGERRGSITSTKQCSETRSWFWACSNWISVRCLITHFFIAYIYVHLLFPEKSRRSTCLKRRPLKSNFPNSRMIRGHQILSLDFTIIWAYCGLEVSQSIYPHIVLLTVSLLALLLRVAVGTLYVSNIILNKHSRECKIKFKILMLGLCSSSNGPESMRFFIMLRVSSSPWDLLETQPHCWPQE